MASRDVHGSTAPVPARAANGTRLHAAEAKATGLPKHPTTMACVALMRDTVDDMLEGTREAQRAGADLVELRLDALKEFDPSNDIPRLINESALPMIITLRPTWEGGLCELPEPRRLAALRYAASLGATFVDVEFKVADYFFRGKVETREGTQFIVSSHDFEGTPATEKLDRHVARCRALENMAPAPLIVKLVTTAVDGGDALRVLGVVRRAASSGHPMIGLAMGEAGVPARLLAGVAGGVLTFATLDDGAASAPGQPSLRQLLTRFRLHEQAPGATRVYGVVGDPVSHSKGPLLHNTLLQSHHQDAVYVPFLVKDFPRFLHEARASGLDLAGLSVTIPHKEAALEAADEADSLATSIGAANTLVFEGGGAMRGPCRAWNTDARAAVAAIERGLTARLAAAGPAPTQAATGRSGDEQAFQGSSPLQGRTVVILGSGGAGKAVASAAAQAGARVIVANRTLSRAEDLVAHVAAAQPGASVRAVSLDSVRLGQVWGDVLANTTQLGMHPKVQETPVPKQVLARFVLVFDAVYTPLHTRLLLEAKEEGCSIVTGDTMFIGQAAEQFRLFTGISPDEAAMKEALSSNK